MVIGAGASALMFGANVNKPLVFIDANPYIGAKIKISGGGKCNITNKNVSARNYLGDESFVSKALNVFSGDDTLKFFEAFGVVPALKKEGRYFCETSAQVLRAFTSANTRHKFLFNQSVKNIDFKNGKFIVQLSNNEQISSDKLIVSSGGLSYKTLNASDIGYKIARYFDMKVKTPSPSLVGLSLQKEQFWMKELSGVSFAAKIRYEDFLYEEDLLFSHRGISGPVVLNASLRWERGSISIDFLPSFDFGVNSLIWGDKRQLTTILPLPKSFVKAFLSSVELTDKPLKLYSAREREKIVLLKNYIMSPAGTFGFSKAEVTKGGVSVSEIEPSTFESKKQKGLYFIGEVLDVTGELGGYNLQWAFSSGFCAARNF